MCPSIEIDADVWEMLKREAEPLVDTPNSVLRRLLALADGSVDRGASEGGPSSQAPSNRPRGAAKKGKRARKRAPRAPVGSLLPETEYEAPLLRALGDRGGSSPAREAIQRVGVLIEDRLMPLDRETQPNGLKRWETRVQFTRLRMRKGGLIASASPRGVWELSKLGRAAYDELGAL
jgi:hypothetical protein